MGGFASACPGSTGLVEIAEIHNDAYEVNGEVKSVWASEPWAPKDEPLGDSPQTHASDCSSGLAWCQPEAREVLLSPVILALEILRGRNQDWSWRLWGATALHCFFVSSRVLFAFGLSPQIGAARAPNPGESGCFVPLQSAGPRAILPGRIVDW